MSGLGSVFLGDRFHHILHPHTNQPTSPTTPAPLKRAVVDPVLSLQLRIRWLEALVLGLKQSKDPLSKAKATQPTQTQNQASGSGSANSNSNLWRRAEDIQRTLTSSLESNEECLKFLTDYNKYAHLLTPAAATSLTGSSEPPTYDNLSNAELEALVLELEPDIRAADRDLREIDELDGRGVTAAGKLQEHELQKGRLQALVEAQVEDLALYDQLEARTSNILQAYVTHITRLSELFVSWNDLVTEAEEQVDALQRKKHDDDMLTF